MFRLSQMNVVALTIVALVATACGAASPTEAPTAAPTTAPSAAPTTAPTTAPTAMASESAVPATETPAPTTAVVATIPSDQLTVAGHLLVCSDIPYPPLEYLDAQGNPTGSDMEIAAGIAERLGLQLEVVNSVFDTIILAVTSGKCDIIISDQNITPDRLQQVDMIPYQQFGQSFAVLAGNPENLTTTTDLCGKKVGAETGTTEVDYAQGSGAYKGDGLPKVCADAGKPAAEVKQFSKDSDAFLALTAKQVDVYFADVPVVAYYVGQQPDQFMVAPIPQIEPIIVGISVPQGKTAVEDAVKTALLAMMNDGSYLQILTKYNVQIGAIQPSDVVIQKSK